MPRFFTIALAVSAGFAIPTQASNIVSDGGFESATLALYTAGVNGSIGDGWNVTSGQVTVWNNPLLAPGVAYDGNNSAYIDYGNGVDTLDQTLTTAVSQQYTVSFWVADNFADPLTVSFGGVTIFNGTAPTNGISSVSDFVNYTFTPTATSTSSDLSFSSQFTYNGQYGIILDDVSVTATGGGSSVPEPGTIAFLGIGCLALIAVREGKRR